MTGTALAVILVSGGVGGSRTTVTVVQSAPLGVSVDRTRTKSGLEVRQIYERSASGVVFVNATGVIQAQSPSEYLRGESEERGTATGSGFEVDGRGTILTNWHVIEGATTITVGLGHGRTVAANVVAHDASSDVAALRILTAGLTLHPLALGDSAKAHIGETVLAIGNPFGLERTLTTGIVSALQRRIQAPNGVTISSAIQTDAAINPGNSGGPLLNEQGEVIGINSQIETAGGHAGNVGIAFAIPIDTAKSELATLERGGTVRGG